MLVPIIHQWNPIFRQGDAVEHGLPDASIDTLRVFDMDMVGGFTEPVGETVSGPISWNAGVDL